MGNILVALRSAAIAAIAVALTGLAGARAQTPVPAPTCDSIITDQSNPPIVTSAFNQKYAANKKAKEAKEIALGDVIAVEGTDLDKLLKKECASRSLVLFIDDLPMRGLVRNPPTSPTDKFFYFTLRRTADARDSWLPILGSARFTPKDVRISVGFADGFAMKADVDQTTLKFRVIPFAAFFWWGAVFLAMLILFVVLARCTNVIRDPAPVATGKTGTYSLSRIQGALWFFVILAAFLFIGIITGDFSNTVNDTAVILLGIGAGTVVGSAAIDAQKKTDKDNADTAKAIQDVRDQLTKVDADISAVDEALKAPNLSEADRFAKQAGRADLVVKKEDLESQKRKLYGQSEGWLIDILSDANGISFHRFQMAGWTAVLAIIFVVDVWKFLEMPTFNTTLMGLLGLSAGTYLGLKIPEPTTPTKRIDPGKPGG